MNKLLDLEKLLYENKQRERNKLDIFESVLEQCHNVIDRYNRENHVRCCYFNVPAYIFGKPAYDLDVLVNYLIHHLEDNGLYCEYNSFDGTLYISWKDEDINEEKYLKRKALIEARHRNEAQMRGIENIPVEEDKYNQARRLKRSQEREFRIGLKKNRVPTTTNYQDFMKSFY